MKRFSVLLLCFISISSILFILYQILMRFFLASSLISWYWSLGWFFIFLPHRILLPYVLISTLGIEIRSLYVSAYLQLGTIFFLYLLVLGILGIIGVLLIRKEKRMGVQILRFIGVVLLITGVWNAVVIYFFYSVSAFILLFTSGLNIVWGIVYLVIAQYFSRSFTPQNQLEVVKGL